jgi:hypothetical protein
LLALAVKLNALIAKIGDIDGSFGGPGNISSLEGANGFVKGFYDSLISWKMIIVYKCANCGSKIRIMKDFKLNSG